MKMIPLKMMDFWNGDFSEYPRKFALHVSNLYYYKPGVYFLWKHGELQYIGQSENVSQRVRGHRVFRMSERKGWVVGVIPVKSRVKRFALERECIKRFAPPLNKQQNPNYKILRRPVEDVFGEQAE